MGRHFGYSVAPCWCIHSFAAGGKIKCESVCFNYFLCRFIQEDVAPVSTAGGTAASNIKKFCFHQSLSIFFRMTAFFSAKPILFFATFPPYFEFLTPPLRFLQLKCKLRDLPCVSISLDLLNVKNNLKLIITSKDIQLAMK